MKKGKIKTILKDDIEKLAELSDSILPDFNEEQIHKLRTHVKKLRAFLRLITTDNKQPDVKLSKKFKDLYHIAGFIRDAQLMEKRIADWHIQLPAYKERLQADIGLQKYFWTEHYNKKILKQLDDKITNHRFHDLQIKILEKFLKTQISDISRVLEEEPDNERIHDYRKKVKGILYNIKLAEDKWRAASDILIDFPLKQLEELSDIIGNYNDDRIMLDHLSSFSSPDLQPEEQNALNSIHTEGTLFLESREPVVLNHLKDFVRIFS